MSKLRVYHIRNGEQETHLVNYINHAKDLIDNLAKSDLLDSSVVYNVFGLEEFNEETKQWEEWYDDEGRDIDEHFAEENE